MEHSCQDRGVWSIDLEIPSELWMSSLSKPRVLPQPLNLGFLIFLCEHQNLNMRISQPTKSWQGPCIQCTDVIVSVLAMFPTISPTPSWIFSAIQAHPSVLETHRGKARTGIRWSLRHFHPDKDLVFSFTVKEGGLGRWKLSNCPLCPQDVWGGVLLWHSGSPHHLAYSFLLAINLGNQKPSMTTSSP